jgi:hypothetical protein
MEINKIDPWMTSLRQEMSASVHFLQMASWQLMVSTGRCGRSSAENVDGVRSRFFETKLCSGTCKVRLKLARFA